MSRLLQGDVGSGKTVIALGLAAAGVDAGIQTAIMAPTEVLAEQLYSQTQKFLSPSQGWFVHCLRAGKPDPKEHH